MRRRARSSVVPRSSSARPRAFARAGAVFLLAVLSVAGPGYASGGAVPAGASASRWVRPVPGALVRAFDPPASRYGPGHVGADLAAAPGTPVRAAGAGTVVFAGAVAGGLHVVVRHATGWRTTYAFLTAVTVRTGRVVAAGDVVGATGGTGEHHDGSVLHFGLRIGDDYADPMLLFGDDLTALVHLAPVAGPSPPADERAALARTFPPAPVAPAVRAARAGFVENPVLCPAPGVPPCG